MSLTLEASCSMLMVINYIIAILLLVSCMSTRNHLLCFARFCAGSTPKIANKNIQQKTLPGFITISCKTYDQKLLCEADSTM